MAIIVNRLDNMPKEVRQRISRNLAEAGRYYIAEVEKIVHVYGGPGVHSPPGHAPYWQTGRFANSFYMKISDLKLRVLSSAPYAKYLENGTSRMAPRPYAAVTWAKHAKAIRAIILRR